MGAQNDWTWYRQGVTLYADHLLWYEDLGSVAYASGAASEQSFADFLAHGPSVGGVPQDVLTALIDAVGARVALPGGT